MTTATRIFQKNLTSKLLVDTLVDLEMTPETRCLDLGCGDGNIVLEVAQQKNLSKVCGSDVSEIAIELASHNASEAGVQGDFRRGDSFSPWQGEKFDVISCDVAAISRTIADISDWYDGVDCDTGEDGLKLIAPVIDQAKDYLEEGGIFVIPAISLANEGQLLAHLENNFRDVQAVAKKEWPMPGPIMDKLKSAQLPVASDNWTIAEKFGLFIAHTSVYKCTGSKG